MATIVGGGNVFWRRAVPSLSENPEQCRIPEVPHAGETPLPPTVRETNLNIYVRESAACPVTNCPKYYTTPTCFRDVKDMYPSKLCLTPLIEAVVLRPHRPCNLQRDSQDTTGDVIEAQPYYHY